MPEPSERVRVVFTMQRIDHDELKSAASKAGMTVSQFVRAGVIAQKYIKQRQRDGAVFLVEDGGVQREVFFR